MEDNLKNRSDIHISIDKTLIPEMPVVTFPGTITVADTPEKISQAIDILSKETIVGFDTETRPSFKKGHPTHVALMQISTENHCFLFRVNITGITEPLRWFIENPAICKVGLSLKDDFMVMHRSDDFTPAAFIDLQNIVKEYCISDLGLQRIYAILFGERISKHQRLTNWEAATLTIRQQIYASIDAWACLRIYHHLSSGLFDPEQSPYRLPPESLSEV